MGKLGLAGVSLVAAVPGGLLAWLLVGGFMNQLDKMPLLLQIVSGLTLLISAGTVLLPPAALIFGPKAADTGETVKKDKKAKDEAGDEDVVEDVVDEGEGALEDAESEVESFDDAGGDEIAAEDFVAEESTEDAFGEGESLDDSSVEMAESDDFDPFEDDSK